MKKLRTKLITSVSHILCNGELLFIYIKEKEKEKEKGKS